MSGALYLGGVMTGYLCIVERVHFHVRDGVKNT